MIDKSPCLKPATWDQSVLFDGGIHDVASSTDVDGGISGFD